MPYLRKRVKKGIIFENLGKNIQNLKIYEKVHPHSCDYHMHKTSRMCPVISVRWAYHQSKEVVCLDPGLSLVGWYLGGPWYQGGADNSSALNVHSVIFQLKTNIQQHLTKSTIWKNAWIIWTMVHINYLNMILLPKLRPRHWNS